MTGKHFPAQLEFLLESLVHNLVLIWTGGGMDAYVAFATGTIITCSPVYLIFGGLWAFGVKVPKELNKVLHWVMIANAILALLPFAIPLGVAYYGGRFLYAFATGQPLIAPQPRQRRVAHREEPEEDHDDAEDEEH